MQRALDVPDLFAELARAIAAALEADACVVSMIQDGGTVVRSAATGGHLSGRLGEAAMPYALDDYPATLDVIRTGAVVQHGIGDPALEPGEREILDELGFERLLMSRITVDERPIGLIEVYRRADVEFAPSEVSQLGVLCSFAENAYARIDLTARLEAHYTTTIEALLSALEARDPNTQAHTSRIRDLALALAISMRLPAEMRMAVRLGAILHDVGKIGISDTILLKAGPLTDEEWVIMREHPVIGERMLSGIEFLAPALPIVRHHHERWDGGGYPDGLAGDAIPLGARIVAVCDTFDAMTSDRPYRRAQSAEAACAEVLACAGRQFDPDCAALLVDVVSRFGTEQVAGQLVRRAG